MSMKLGWGFLGEVVMIGERYPKLYTRQDVYRVCDQEILKGLGCSPQYFVNAEVRLIKLLGTFIWLCVDGGRVNDR